MDPVDVLLLSTAVPTIAFAGVTEVPEEAWSIVERAVPAYGDDWWFTGLLAFVRQEQCRFDEAMELSAPVPGGRAGRRPLRPRPRARPLRDRRPRGRAGLDGRFSHRRRRRSIPRCERLRVARLALHELSLGDLEAVGLLVRRAAAARARAGLPGPGSDPRGRCCSVGADPQNANDVPATFAQVADLAAATCSSGPSTPFLALHSAGPCSRSTTGPGRPAGEPGRHPRPPHPPRGGRSPGPDT